MLVFVAKCRIRVGSLCAKRSSAVLTLLLTPVSGIPVGQPQDSLALRPSGERIRSRASWLVAPHMQALFSAGDRAARGKIIGEQARRKGAAVLILLLGFSHGLIS